MNETLKPELYCRLMDVLTPHLINEPQRHSHIDWWCYGYPNLYIQIDWAGAPNEFTGRIILLFQRFGSVEKGKPALDYLLASVQRDIGVEGQAKITELRQILASRTTQRSAIQTAETVEHKTSTSTDLNSEKQGQLQHKLCHEKLFQAIVDHAYMITGASHLAYLALNIEQGIQIIATCPTERFPLTSVAQNQSERIGISGRASQTGHPQLVTDVTVDPDYICYDASTFSELAVPIINMKGDILGIIDVQHTDAGAFCEIDQKNIETLANSAATIEGLTTDHDRKTET